MKKNIIYQPIQNSSGFITADFLFSFALVLSIGVFVFGLTFSLATIEIDQYIVWSTARNYSAANKNETAAKQGARRKFQNLSANFPKLTGNGTSGNPWFELLESNLVIGDLGKLDTQFSSEVSADDIKNKDRQPWIGASTKIKLKLFAGLKLPFLGKVAENESDFEFPIRAFVLRHPSQSECRDFFYKNRYTQGIKKLENGSVAESSAPQLETNEQLTNGFGEDNGC